MAEDGTEPRPSVAVSLLRLHTDTCMWAIDSAYAAARSLIYLNEDIWWEILRLTEPLIRHEEPAWGIPS